jgi:phosphate-selective porin OprO and OprP
MGNTTGKITRVLKGPSLIAAVIASLAASSAAMADTGTATTSSAGTTAQLEAQIEALQAKVNQLQAQENQQSNDTLREAQISAVVKQVLSDAQFRSQYMDDSLQAGYNKGFFIQNSDGDFKLNINGQLQYRYTYAQADRTNNFSQFAGKVQPASSSTTSNPLTGDTDGFAWRRARIIFSGNVFTPNLTFKVMGDFGDVSSNTGNFQMQDVYMAYKVTPWLQFRAGDFLVPFTHVEYISSGLEFPDFNPVVDAFDPVRALGFSVYGDIIPHQMDYEVNVNDGVKSNLAENPAQFGNQPTTLGNRPTFAARWEMFDSADSADFTSEPDINWTQNLEWMLGLAFLYTSQNPYATASNGGSINDGTTGAIYGLSANNTPGFVANQAIAGNEYRAEADATFHFQGLSISPVVFYQQINQDTNLLPPHGPSLPAYYGTNSIGQLGYYVQGGYFIVPHQWELAASFGQLYTLNVANAHNAATFVQAGVNYYLYGNNAKIQVAETYTPLAPFTDANYGTSQNTRDYITQVQFQLAF